ncbi:MAG TPA: glycine reductase [Clostridiaceae bacterium]|nr:glycine reductase [Clostridiaceae bacterium]
MSQDDLKKVVAEAFNDIADGISSNTFEKKVRVGLTMLGSEHGTEELVKAANMAKHKYGDFDVILIGQKSEHTFESYEAETPEECHMVMEKLLDEGAIDCAVTMHYNFPIGVSTVGRVVTPGCGKEMTIATTTGTYSTNRVESMVRNAISGIITAKAMGNTNPSVGILNVDGAKQVERALKELNSNGYEINFAASVREDGGCVMRGNDLLSGTPDVMVTDTLTGNLLVKIFSSFTTGGSYESLGYGYGPGIGRNYGRIICIISRASGAPVICEALRYAAILSKNKLTKVKNREFENVCKAGYDEILDRIKSLKETGAEIDKVVAPPKRVVTYAIAGIDILELEDAVKELWKNGVYSESGMGCTGPIILVGEDEKDKAESILIKNKYIMR